MRYDGLMHILEITKAREYDNGTVRVVAKNSAGEASQSSAVTVVPRADLRSHLKQPSKRKPSFAFNIT